MNPIPPTTPIEVTLEAQQWNTVCQLLNEVAAPHRIVAPILQALTKQLVNYGETNVVPMTPPGAA